MDKLLLHSCCAPCSVYCVDTLRADGIEPTSLWFNPNIHPWTEYDARRRTLLEYGEKEHVPASPCTSTCPPLTTKP